MACSVPALAVAALLAIACTSAQGPLGAPMVAASSGAGGVSVSSPAPSSDTAAGCFGDSPPQSVMQDGRPRDLFAIGGQVVWRSGGKVRRMDEATGQVWTVDASTLMFVRAADSRGVFGADNVLNLVALDLPGGGRRVVASSMRWPQGSGTRALPGVVTLFGAQYALDADYIYVGWVPDPFIRDYLANPEHIRPVKGPHDFGDLARVKRDGSAPPEYLGRGPEARFLVHEGYAYWGSRLEGIKRRALVPGAPNEVVWPAPDVPFLGPIGIAGGRIFFSQGLNLRQPFVYSIESVPITPAAAPPSASAVPDGGAPEPRVHVASMETSFVNAILDGRCAYSGGAGGVTRANLEDGTVTRLIDGHPPAGDATVFGVTFLAADGRYLYWADYGDDLHSPVDAVGACPRDANNVERLAALAFAAVILTPP